MPTIVQTHAGASSTNDLREFSELLRYELAMDNLKTETIMDAIAYMEKRGFRVYRDKK